MRKGFTLVELLAVIVILGIVAGITVPIITGSLNESKNKAYEEQKNIILGAARSYMSKNPSLLPKTGSRGVLVSTLKSEGFIDNRNISNPLYLAGTTAEKTKSQYFNGIVCVSYSSNKYNYTYKESSSC